MFRMTKVVRTIIKDIKDNPSTWKAEDRLRGIVKGNIVINGYGNTRVLSVVDLSIGDGVLKLSYTESWKLEAVIAWWYKTCSAEHIGVKYND